TSIGGLTGAVSTSSLGLQVAGNYFNKDTDDTDDITEGATNLFSQWLENGSDIYYMAGNVGIGTTSPAYKLDINGDIGRSSGDIVMYAGLKDVSNFWFRTGVGGNYTDELVIDSSANTISLVANSLLVPSGNVGIGTSTP